MKKEQISPASILSRIIEVIAAEMDGETVMISIDNGKYYGMDTIGSRIWELLEIPKSLAELVHILSEEYEVGQHECQSDILEFLDYLYREGLIKVA